MKYYIGLDNGGTTTKAALFSKDGKEIAVASVSTAMITPAPGFVERDMEEMWQANCMVIRNVLEKAAISASAVAGIGICGHGKGLYLWGKDGKPVRNGIISTDNRAYGYVARWQQDGTEEKVEIIWGENVGPSGEAADCEKFASGAAASPRNFAACRETVFTCDFEDKDRRRYYRFVIPAKKPVSCVKTEIFEEYKAKYTIESITIHNK